MAPQDPLGIVGETAGLSCRVGCPQEGPLPALSDRPPLLALLGLPPLCLSSLLSCPWDTALAAEGTDVRSPWDC